MPVFYPELFQTRPSNSICSLSRVRMPYTTSNFYRHGPWWNNQDTQLVAFKLITIAPVEIIVASQVRRRKRRTGLYPKRRHRFTSENNAVSTISLIRHYSYSASIYVISNLSIRNELRRNSTVCLLVRLIKKTP